MPKRRPPDYGQVSHLKRMRESNNLSQRLKRMRESNNLSQRQIKKSKLLSKATAQQSVSATVSVISNHKNDAPHLNNATNDDDIPDLIEGSDGENDVPHVTLSSHQMEESENEQYLFRSDGRFQHRGLFHRHSMMSTISMHGMPQSFTTFALSSVVPAIADASIVYDEVVGNHTQPHNQTLLGDVQQMVKQKGV